MFCSLSLSSSALYFTPFPDFSCSNIYKEMDDSFIGNILNLLICIPVPTLIYLPCILFRPDKIQFGSRRYPIKDWTCKCPCSLIASPVSAQHMYILSNFPLFPIHKCTCVCTAILPLTAENQNTLRPCLDILLILPHGFISICA